MKKRAALLIATSLLSLAGLAPSAHAGTTLNTCPLVASWTFSPALTMNNHSGTITATYSGACEYMNVGGIPLVTPEGWTMSYSYYGNCETANVSNYWFSGNVGSLIGGSAFFVSAHNPYYDTSTWIETDVLAPVIPCNETLAIGPALFVFEGTF